MNDQKTMDDGCRIFRAVAEIEAMAQDRVFCGYLPPDDPILEKFEGVYRTLLSMLEGISGEAFTDEFPIVRAMVMPDNVATSDFSQRSLHLDEVRSVVGSFEIDIRPHEELLTLMRPDNPDPLRYGD